MSRMYGNPDDGVWTTEVSELENCVNVARAILPERLNNLPILASGADGHERCRQNEVYRKDGYLPFSPRTIWAV